MSKDINELIRRQHARELAAATLEKAADHGIPERAWRCGGLGERQGQEPHAGLR